MPEGRHLDSWAPSVGLLVLGIGTHLVRASSLLKGTAPVILWTQLIQGGWRGT